MTLWVYNNGLRYFNLSEAAAASWLLLIADMLIALSLLWARARIQRGRRVAQL